MPALDAVRLWLRALFRRRQVERDLDREMRFHLDMEIAQNVRDGMSPSEARRVAFVRFGGVARHTESVRDEFRLRWLEDGAQDLRYALRSLRRTPGFTTVAILTLALGIGVNTAMFTVINGVLLRPLSFPDPGRLVLLHYGTPDFDGGAPSLTDQQFAAIRDHARSFEDVAAFPPSGRRVTMTGAGEPAIVSAASVTPGFFKVLGVQPAIGRGFAAADGRHGAPHVVVLGAGLWREHFGADSHVIGKTVSLAASSIFDRGTTLFTVIGVMPAGFDFPARVQLWIPEADGPLPAGFRSIEPAVARLRDGVTPEHARAEVEAIAGAVPLPARVKPAVRVARVLPLAQLLVRNSERSLFVFAGAVAFVLLIACANVANLMLARASSRTQEMAVRATLGASRWRLMRQVLTESTLLSLIGAAVGLVVAVGGVRALLALAPAGAIARTNDIHVDGPVLAFTAAIALFIGIAFGLAPALRVSRRTLGESVGHGTRLTAGPHLIRNGLVVSEFALALVLLTGAGLMIRSFLRLRDVELGFRPQQVVTMSIDLGSNKYETAEQMMAFHDRTLNALARVPQEIAVGAVSFRPLAGGMNLAVMVDGQPSASWGAWTPAISADYFHAMGIPILNGRTFTDHEEQVASAVAVVSRRVAESAWPGASAIGKRIAVRWRTQPASSPNWLTVVGVVGDVRQDQLTQPLDATIYQPISQAASLTNPDLARMGVYDLGILRRMSYLVRTAGDPGSVERAMSEAVHQVDPDVPVQSLGLLTDLIAANRSEPLFQARLLGAFSFIALLLAAVGIYGVLAYSITERTREIGIRMALGAEPSQMVRMVIRRSLLFAGIGIVLGAAGALATTRVLSKFLYGVTATDPATFVATASLLAAVALIATFVPARRASRVDPAITLRLD